MSRSSKPMLILRHRVMLGLWLQGFQPFSLFFLNASTGTEILTVQAADNDDPKTDNVRIFYRLAGQVPESPRQLFRVDRDSGVITVQADSMEGTAPQYTLTIIAEDAKGCTHTHHYQPSRTRTSITLSHIRYITVL